MSHFPPFGNDFKTRLAAPVDARRCGETAVFPSADSSEGYAALVCLFRGKHSEYRPQQRRLRQDSCHSLLLSTRRNAPLAFNRVGPIGRLKSSVPAGRPPATQRSFNSISKGSEAGYLDVTDAPSPIVLHFPRFFPAFRPAPIEPPVPVRYSDAVPVSRRRGRGRIPHPAEPLYRCRPAAGGPTSAPYSTISIVLR